MYVLGQNKNPDNICTFICYFGIQLIFVYVQIAETKHMQYLRKIKVWWNVCYFLLIAFYACSHRMDNKIVVINHEKQFCVHNYVRYDQCFTEDWKQNTHIQAAGLYTCN